MDEELPTRDAIERDWRGVRLNQNRVLINTSIDPPFHSSEFKDLCHSLVLVHAYGVLQAALKRLAADNAFRCRSSRLGDLMDASHAQSFSWIGYDRLWQGKDRRDEIAHEAKSIPQTGARELIRLIDENLRAWGFHTPKAPPELRGVDQRDEADKAREH